MTYHTDNRVRKYMQGYGFLSFAKKLGTKFGKKFVNKGINESKYGKELKKEGLKFTKTSGKQILEKTTPVVSDSVGSKIADKITSLTNKPQEEPQEQPQEEQEIIVLPERRQHITDELRLF